MRLLSENRHSIVASLQFFSSLCSPYSKSLHPEHQIFGGQAILFQYCPLTVNDIFLYLKQPWEQPLGNFPEGVLENMEVQTFNSFLCQNSFCCLLFDMQGLCGYFFSQMISFVSFFCTNVHLYACLWSLLACALCHWMVQRPVGLYSPLGL